MKRLILTFLFATWTCCVVDGLCQFAKHSSVAAKSCRHILEVQRECFKENGMYWLLNETIGGEPYQVYCDMNHKGGGWRRLIYYHSNTSTSCPTGFTTEIIDGESLCKKVQGVKLLGQEDHALAAWNTDQSIQFTEIRGYIRLRVRYGFPPDGFSDERVKFSAQGHIDGFQFMTTSGGYPSLPYRPYFSYVVGSTTAGHRCPINGGSSENIQTQSYRDYTYACDEIDLNGPRDSNDFYQQELFGSHCVQCPAGSPWFEQTYAGPLVSTSVYGQLVNTDDTDEYIYLSDIELYVR